MLVMAINGSPRKNGATSALLRKALEGAASKKAETEFVQLSELKMRGCQGCFSCKKRGGRSYGKCALKDDMTPLYKRIEQAGALFLGSPMYFHSVTAEMKMFIERLYPYFSYKDFTSGFPKKINVGMIYTMGADQQDMEKWYRKYIRMNEILISMTIGPVESLVSTDTMHVDDYTKIFADMLEPLAERKMQHKREIFPQDCKKAYEMGVRFAGQGATR
jgi:multimeric flavodoxin WrbA